MIRKTAMLFVLSIASCATCTGHTSLPAHLRATDAEELNRRMKAAAVATDTYTAEVRLTAFGPDGRVRGTASLAVRRPASLRYELMGPHGGVLTALATNGRELQFLDLAASRFFYGPATPANIDTLLDIAPLGWGPGDWVSLLFGEVSIPSSADLAYDSGEGLFVLFWSRDEKRLRVHVEPDTSRVVRASVWVGQNLVSEIHIEQRDAYGLPVRLRVHVMNPETDVRIHLRDVERDAKLDDSVFHLDPPSGIAPEYLGHT
jgi:outer membrane lipoprotein-sorting protein